MLIQNYGLHWKRSNLYTETHGDTSPNVLMGRLSRLVHSDPVDFRSQSGIYVLHDGFRCVYVGQVGRGKQRLLARLKEHSKNHLAERWDRFSWFGMFPVKDEVLDLEFNVKKTKNDIDDILDHIEGALIAITEPPLNRRGASWGDCEQYTQYIDTDLADEEDNYEEE